MPDLINNGGLHRSIYNIGTEGSNPFSLGAEAFFADENYGKELIFLAGNDVKDEPVYKDLAVLPHILVSGAHEETIRSFIDTVLCSLIARYRQGEFRCFIIGRGANLKEYEHIPQLLTKNAVTGAVEAIKIFKWLTSEIDRRYNLFAEAKVDCIFDYNNLSNQEKLYRIVVFIEEIESLIDKDTLENDLEALYRLGRRAGIHLVIASHRPEIFARFSFSGVGARICFCVNSPGDSVVFIGSKEAANIKGDEFLIKTLFSKDIEKLKLLRICTKSKKECICALMTSDCIRRILYEES